MKKFNIVFTTDHNYFRHLCVTLISLLINNSDCEFRVFVIFSGVDNKRIEKLNRMISDYHCDIITLNAGEDLFGDLTVTNSLTRATFYRLMIPDLINEKKVLYLDTDIVVNGSIAELYQEDISDSYLAAVIDPYIIHREALKMKKDAKYFNSGVMLINVERWNKEGIGKRAIKFIRENSELLKHNDQCGLNAVINGQWKALPSKYNYFSVAENEKGKENPAFPFETYEVNISPVIIHYAGPKPWHLGSKVPYGGLYWKYLKKTPFYSPIPEKITPKNFLKSILPATALKKYHYWKNKFFLTK